MKTIEVTLSLPFIFAGLAWEFIVTGFRAGRVLYAMISPE